MEQIVVLRHFPSMALQAAFTSKKKARKYLLSMRHVADVTPIEESEDRHAGFWVAWDNGAKWELELIEVEFDPK